MKRKVLLFAAFAGLLTITLSSYRSGMIDAVEVRNAGGTTSGSPEIIPGMIIGSNTLAPVNDCGDVSHHYTVSCHQAGNGSSISVNTIVWQNPTMTVLNTSNGFRSNANYTIQITATTTGSTYVNDVFFGFQCIIYAYKKGTTVPVAPGWVDGTTASALPITAGGTSIANDSVRQGAIIVEQRRQLQHRWLPTNAQSYEINFQWNAPDSSTCDSVVIESILCAVDSDGTPNGDLFYGAPTIRLHKSTTSVFSFGSSNFSVYPNPVNNELNLQMSNLPASHYFLTMYDISGRQVLTRDIATTGNNQVEHMNTSTLVPGIYHLSISNGVSPYVMEIIKQ